MSKERGWLRGFLTDAYILALGFVAGCIGGYAIAERSQEPPAGSGVAEFLESLEGVCLPYGKQAKTRERYMVCNLRDGRRLIVSKSGGSL